MTNDKAPDNATGDSVTNAELITRVHAFMAALLTFLGFNVLPTETVFDMLDALTQWLADAKKLNRDPRGVMAQLWWDAFRDMWRDDEMTASDCARNADAAVVEFGKRFLPVVEEEERDTLNTADFDALRDELNRADAQFDEIVAALEGRTVEFRFPTPQAVAGLRAERDALLKTNAHHASEIESLRQERDKLKALRSADLLEMAAVVDALDAVRAAILAPALADVDVAPMVKRIVGERNAMHAAICDAVGMHHGAYFDREKAVASLRTERDELKAQLASAIVPLPKPERVEPGQRWALVIDVGDPLGSIAAPRRSWYIGNGVTRFCIELPYDMSFAQSSMVYLGKDT